MNTNFLNKSQLAKQFGRNVKTISSILRKIPSEGVSSSGSPGWLVSTYQVAKDTYVKKLDYSKQRQFYDEDEDDENDDYNTLSNTSNKITITKDLHELYEASYKSSVSLANRQNQYIEAIRGLTTPEQMDKIMLPIIYPNEPVISGSQYFWSK